MPPVLVVAVLVTASALLVAYYFLTRKPARPAQKPQQPQLPSAPPQPSNPPGNDALAQLRATASQPSHIPAPPSQNPAPTPNVPRVYTDVPDVEITQMGAVPPEILAMMRGKLKGDPKPEENVDVDVELDELVDESALEDPTGANALILVTGFARSDRGLKRNCNEDAFLCLDEEPLYVVADGMGGHAAGDVASKTAVETMEKVFRQQSLDVKTKHGWPRRGEELVAAIEAANEAVYQIACSDEKYHRMGTTVVAIRFAPNKQRAYIAHVGDSRCYRIRNNDITQITEDHTLGRLLGISGKTAKHLARAVGIGPQVAVDLTIDQPKPGDYFLICSDGLNKMMPDRDILRFFLDAEGGLDDRARALIDEANQRGGRDNITVIAIGVETPKL